MYLYGLLNLNHRLNYYTVSPMFGPTSRPDSRAYRTIEDGGFYFYLCECQHCLCLVCFIDCIYVYLYSLLWLCPPPSSAPH